MKPAVKQEHSEAFLKQRRFMVMIPILVFPFLMMLFWILGGGSGKTATAAARVQGINTQLPGAENTEDSSMDKMAFYNQAQQDSIARTNSGRNDPYRLTDSAGVGPTNNRDPQQGISMGLAGSAGPAYNGGAGTDPNEEKIRQKLAALNANLNAGTGAGSAPTELYRRNPEQGTSRADIDRLEALMGSVQSSGAAADPEMAQINGVLGQILDIQHPERVQQRLRATSARNMGKVYAVTSVRPDDAITSLDDNLKSSARHPPQNGFYSINDEPKDDGQNTIAAVMHETQTLITGSVVKLRLVNDIFINGKMIPRNTFIFGMATVAGERLGIDINSVRYKNSIYPVKLSVFDLDGMDGIYIPDAISRNVAKQSGDNAIQNLSIPTLDPSIGTQAMGAGLEAAKSLIGQKVRLIKVIVKAGYQILLKDDKQKDDQ
jgi:conjugative transposon TraM protein